MQNAKVQCEYRLWMILVSFINKHKVGMANIVPVVLKIDRGCVCVSMRILV